MATGQCRAAAGCSRVSSRVRGKGKGKEKLKTRHAWTHNPLLLHTGATPARQRLKTSANTPPSAHHRCSPRSKQKQHTPNTALLLYSTESDAKSRSYCCTTQHPRDPQGSLHTGSSVLASAVQQMRQVALVVLNRGLPAVAVSTSRAAAHTLLVSCALCATPDEAAHTLSVSHSGWTMLLCSSHSADAAGGPTGLSIPTVGSHNVLLDGAKLAPV